MEQRVTQARHRPRVTGSSRGVQPQGAPIRDSQSLGRLADCLHGLAKELISIIAPGVPVGELDLVTQRECPNARLCLRPSDIETMLKHPDQLKTLMHQVSILTTAIDKAWGAAPASLSPDQAAKIINNPQTRASMLALLRSDRFWSDDKLVLQGKVREVSGAADPQSRTFSVRVSLPNDPRVLLGMTATVEANVTNANPYVAVPLSALAEKEGKKIVWIVDRQAATVHAREIKVADFTGDGVNVTEGLSTGDIVVAAGTQFMSENLKVKLPELQAASADVTSSVE